VPFAALGDDSASERPDKGRKKKINDRTTYTTSLAKGGVVG
jgi:hypothetical protein